MQSVAASLAFEYFEMANDRALIVAADQAGASAIRATLDKIKADNETMAQWLSDDLDATTRQYLETAG